MSAAPKVKNAEVKDAAVKHAVAHALVATIVNKSSDKSVTVLIQRQLRHPFYGKYIRRSSKLHVHDEANEGQLGDVVRIVACPRKSKTKAWRLVEILQSAARKELPTATPKTEAASDDSG